MNSVGLIRMVLASIFLMALAIAFSPASRAQEVDLPGQYVCTQAKVEGKSVPCNGTPLVLRTDGHFELHGWQGQYAVSKESVELTDSVVRVQAKLEPGHKIVLHFHGKHGWCEMTYERRIAELGTRHLG